VLTDASCESIRAVLERCEAIVAAWVFGSVARSDATADSDLDIAVLLRGPATDDVRRQLRTLSVELERFSPSARVDIVILGPQGSVFRHRVLREGHLVLDRDPSVRHAFEGRTIAEYLDWRPTHDIAMASTLEGLRRRFSETPP
jgi:predicted nucleotidyltransferase